MFFCEVFTILFKHLGIGNKQKAQLARLNAILF